MTGHFVSHPTEPGFTPELAARATALILAGKSTTFVFRALGYRSANKLRKWLADKPGLSAMLAENARAYKQAMGKKYAGVLRRTP